MKLHQEILELEDQQYYLTEEEQLLVESLLTTLQAGVASVKNYGLALSGALKAHKELKTLDGQKTLSTGSLKEAAIELRRILQDLATAMSDKMREILNSAVKKMGAAPLIGAYTSRNYYKDYMVYTMLKPAADMAGGEGGGLKKVAAEQVMDKVVGAIITSVTGIPNLDDIKDFADMTKGLVKASNTFATKLASLRPAQPAPTPTP